MAKRDQAPPSDRPPGPFNPALAGLAARRGDLPATPAPAAPTGPPPPPRAVVRMERAGRRGKTVTVVAQLGLPPRELERWLGDLKRAMGCGGAIEGGALVLQGDARQRVGAWLEARGVRKVTVA